MLFRLSCGDAAANKVTPRVLQGSILIVDPSRGAVLPPSSFSYQLLLITLHFIPDSFELHQCWSKISVGASIDHSQRPCTTQRATIPPPPAACQLTNIDNAFLTIHFAAQAGSARRTGLSVRDRLSLLIALISRIPAQIRLVDLEVK
jgi:hypothetical protein